MVDGYVIDDYCSGVRYAIVIPHTAGSVIAGAT